MTPIYITIDQEETGLNIQRLMHRNGLKARDIQEACGFEKPQAVYKWIHGQSLPSIDNLLVLAKLFGSTVEGILATSEDALPHLRSFSLFNNTYMYIDTKDHLADQIFIRHRLRVFFKGDYGKEGKEYQIILCKASKKRREDFLGCMRELSRNMLLLGHTDYSQFCGQIQELILKHSKKEKNRDSKGRLSSAR